MQGKHIKDLTTDDLKTITRRRARVELDTYTNEGPSAWPGKLSVPAQCWYSDSAGGPWGYTDEVLTIQEWVYSGSVSIYYVRKESDGTFSYIKRIVEEV